MRIRSRGGLAALLHKQWGEELYCHHPPSLLLSSCYTSDTSVRYHYQITTCLLYNLLTKSLVASMACYQ
jgi:hypothetical protein